MSSFDLSASNFAVDNAIHGIDAKASNCNESILPALDNPVVLRAVFSNINSTTTLKNVRSVSKFWRWESMTQLKNSAVLIINKETQKELIEAYIRSQIEQYKWRLAEDLKPFFHFISEKPFKSYKFPEYGNTTNLLKLPVSQPKPNFWESILWDQYFAFATYFDIDVTVLIAGSCFSELKWLLKKCPCLKTLIINPHLVPSHAVYKSWHLSERDEIARQEHIILQKETKEDAILSPYLECLSFAKSYYVIWQSSALLNQENAVWGFKQLLKGCPKLKHLWTQAGKDGSAQNSKILEAAIQTGHKLESLSLLALFRSESVDFSQLSRYILQVHPPLKIIVLTMNWYDFQRSFNFENFLCGVKDTVKKLELFINCDKKLPEGHRLRRGMDGRWEPQFGDINLCLDLTKRGRKFSALTDFNLVNCYKTFNESPNWKYFNPIVSFNLRGLRNMQKLREFRYESGLNMAKPWVIYKTTVDELRISQQDFSLPDLKHFHFHRGFTSEAIQCLGKWIPNLETFEAVLDQENFEPVLNTWPKLKQITITLLPWSDVPKSIYERTRTVTVVDKSEDYEYRQAWHGSTHGLFEERDKRDWRQLSCFKTKAHHFNL